MSKKEKAPKSEIKTSKIAAPKNIIIEYFESFVVTLLMALFGMTFILQAVTVPTGSMQNTILIGDYFVGKRLTKISPIFFLFKTSL